MNLNRLLLVTALVAACTAGASAQIYTSQAAFEAALGGNLATSCLNNFNSVPNGGVASLNFGPVNGFAYTISTPSGSISGLFNDGGRISTDNAADSILVTFTGAPVFALGGNMWATDINFNPIAANITVNLSNGQTDTFSGGSASTFRGFISQSGAITSFTIAGGTTPGIRWPTLDNLRVGVPEPTTLALLGLGAVGLIRRRR